MHRTLLVALVVLAACASEPATEPAVSGPEAGASDAAAVEAAAYRGTPTLQPLDSLLGAVGRPTAAPAGFVTMGGGNALTPPDELFGDAPDGRFVADTRRPRGAGGLMGPVGLQTVGAVVRMSNEVNGVVGLPRDVTVGTAECVDEDGAPVANAFYAPGDAAITICDELVRTMDGWFAGMDGAHDLKQGALEFIVGHEMGHALVDLLELPVLGRNEDAADLLAIYFSLLGSDVERAAGGMMFFLASGLHRNPDAPLPFWSVHSLDEQRVVTIACMLYGADPDGNAGLVEVGFLPERRAESCPREFGLAVRDVERQLAPYRRDG